MNDSTGCKLHRLLTKDEPCFISPTAVGSASFDPPPGSTEREASRKKDSLSLCAMQRVFPALTSYAMWRLPDRSTATPSFSQLSCGAGIPVALHSRVSSSPTAALTSAGCPESSMVGDTERDRDLLLLPSWKRKVPTLDFRAFTLHRQRVVFPRLPLAVLGHAGVRPRVRQRERPQLQSVPPDGPLPLQAALWTESLF